MKSVSKYYQTTAVLILSALILFIILNVAIEICGSINYAKFISRFRSDKEFFLPDGSPVDNGKRSPYQLEWFDFNAYGNVNPIYAAEVLDDFFILSQKGFIYQPWVQFSEPIFHGKRVNVDLDELGFPIRRTINPQMNGGQIPIKIFVLGGSTTFGYNVSDEHTWPTAFARILNEKSKNLELNLNVQVINYGRGFYYSSQEVVLLIDLLKMGHRPSLVIFMDGVNEGIEEGLNEDMPFFSEKAAKLFRRAQTGSFNDVLKMTVAQLPLIKWAESLKQRLLRHFTTSNYIEPNSEPMLHEALGKILNRYRQNKAIAKEICKLYGIKYLFFAQPSPIYNYPFDLYRQKNLPPKFFTTRRLAQQGYKELDREVINLSSLFNLWGKNKKAIIDDCHYSPSFNYVLAERISSYIDLKMLSNYPCKIDDQSATGSKRTTSGTTNA